MKRTTLRTTPRKIAQQERSRATVDAILQASTYILVRRGWSDLTTNAIAERAGVNISSLYQYFPNKEAIVFELQRRHIAHTRNTVSAILSKDATQLSLREALTCMVEVLIHEHRDAPEMHRVFSEELPRSARSASCGFDGVDDQVLALLQPHLKNVPDPTFAINMTRVATHAIIHEAALYRPDIFERPDFISEVVTLIEPYLCRPTPHGHRTPQHTPKRR